MNTDINNIEQKIPKKRGRKPKGGKIIKEESNNLIEQKDQQNIILHLKCNLNDIEPNIFSLGLQYNPNDIQNVDGYSFNNTSELYANIKDTSLINNSNIVKDTIIEQTKISDDLNDDDDENDNVKNIWKKLSNLEKILHNNDIADKKSACFWCTYDFDNPPIYIPKYYLNNSYYVYGCFCSPECATAYLMKENIDTASKFERYHLLNHIYCKIYNYEKNIKPSPNPFYTLNKYYGNLNIQEWRKLLKTERLLLIVDKPLTRQLPELHQDNDDFIINNNSIPSGNKYKLKRKIDNKSQTKKDILTENFKIS
jgi:hypothetical protein